MPSVSFIYAPGCLAAAAGLVTPLQTSTVHLKMEKLLMSGVTKYITKKTGITQDIQG